MDIRPVPFEQVLLGRDGRTYGVSGEAGRIVQRLHEIDPSLRVHFNEGGMFFVVSQLVDAAGAAVATEADSAGEKLVMRVPADDWNEKVVKDLELRAFEVRNGISAAVRLDRLDAQREKDTYARLEADVGERSYDLFRAFQKDLGINPRIFVPARKRQAQAA